MKDNRHRDTIYQENSLHLLPQIFAKNSLEVFLFPLLISLTLCCLHIYPSRRPKRHQWGRGGVCKYQKMPFDPLPWMIYDVENSAHPSQCGQKCRRRKKEMPRSIIPTNRWSLHWLTSLWRPSVTIEWLGKWQKGWQKASGQCQENVPQLTSRDKNAEQSRAKYHWLNFPFLWGTWGRCLGSWCWNKIILHIFSFLLLSKGLYNAQKRLWNQMFGEKNFLHQLSSEYSTRNLSNGGAWFWVFAKGAL